MVNSASEPSTLDLRQAWTWLVSGRMQILEAFSSEQRSYLALSLEPTPRTRPSDSYFRILQEVLTGVSQKTVAIDHKISPSTVSSTCRQAISYMGLSCLPSKAPSLLCLIAHAAKRPSFALHPWACNVEHAAGPFRTLVSPRLEQCLSGRFSPAQREVLGLLFDGRSHREIALLRGTSVRTVANQIAAIFSSLRVSGRLGLIGYFVGKSHPFVAAERAPQRLPPQ